MTAQARRTQIVAATVEVIAEQGYGRTTFARIAEQAGVSSTRLISYHFASKDELIIAVVHHVITSIGDFVGQRVAAATTAAAKVQVYLESVVEFTSTHREQMRALLQIVLAGALPGGTGADDVSPAHLEEILRQGQTDGEFRDFDPAVMAMTIQRAVEGLPFALESDPDLDCDHFARELVTLFELATQRAGR